MVMAQNFIQLRTCVFFVSSVGKHASSTRGGIIHTAPKVRILVTVPSKPMYAYAYHKDASLYKV